MALTLEIPQPAEPAQPVVPESPTVPADPTPSRETPDTPTGPDTPAPDDPLPPQPDGPDVPRAGSTPPRDLHLDASLIGDPAPRRHNGFDFGDPWGLGLAFAGVAVFAAVGALSHEHERAFSASLIYLGLGVLAAAGLAVLGFDWIDPVQDASLIEHVTELAVVIALFSAGLKVERALRWREWQTVTRLLLIGMPALIVAAAAFGNAVMGLSLGAAVALASALAPTDPVLAGDIGIGPPGEEDEHEPHFAITAEAG